MGSNARFRCSSRSICNYWTNHPRLVLNSIQKFLKVQLLLFAISLNLIVILKIQNFPQVILNTSLWLLFKFWEFFFGNFNYLILCLKLLTESLMNWQNNFLTNFMSIKINYVICLVAPILLYQKKLIKIFSIFDNLNFLFIYIIQACRT